MSQLIRGFGFGVRLFVGTCLVVSIACGGDDDDMNTPDAGDNDASEPMPDTSTPRRDTGMRPADATMMDTNQECGEDCEIAELVVGALHVCARRNNGEVLCWGGNRVGQLGDNRMRHSSCSDSGDGNDEHDCTETPTTVLDVEADWIRSAGAVNTCAGVGGALFCWGREVIPAVGSDQREEIFLATQVDAFDDVMDAATSSSFQCVVTSTGTVECRGDNDSGQLGNGMFMESFDAVDVSGLTGVQELVTATGGQHACVLTSTGVQCWGSDQNGQLGDGESTLEECGRELQEYDCTSTPVTPIGLDAGVESLALGAQHTCVVMSDGTIQCWGANSSGQLGLGNSGIGPAMPTVVPGLSDVVEVAAGRGHTCVRLGDGSVKCFGQNDEGQLGDGAEVDSHERCDTGTEFDCSTTPVDVVLPGAATMIAAGGFTSCAIVDGDVYCWGYNDQRQLGQADRVRRSTPVLVEGL